MIRKYLSILIFLLIFLFTCLFISPKDQILGNGIRSIYVHVAAIWTGLLGFLITGFMALYLTVKPTEDLFKKVQVSGWISLGLVVFSFVFSFRAALINWGNISWNEPRTVSTMQLIAIATIMMILNTWPIIALRIKGVLTFLLTVFIIWRVHSTPFVTHPNNAVSSTQSWSIKATFLTITLIFLLIGITFYFFILALKAQKTGKDI